MSGHTRLVLDAEALAHNYGVLRSKTAPGTALLGVVKAMAYGSDSLFVAQTLAQLGIDYLAVAYVPEGVALREAGIHTPILVLHPQLDQLDDLWKYCLEPSVYSFRILKALSARKEQLPIHIKLNTGLNRLGFDRKDLAQLGDLLNQTPHLTRTGILSHLAASEDPEQDEYTRGQWAEFTAMSEELAEKTGGFTYRHLCNTSGILRFPEAHFNLVRSGIGLYGYPNDRAMEHEFIPFASLYTVISQIHDLKAGHGIGYNRAEVAKQPMKIATLPIGHADGISRIYGLGKGGVWINDQWAPIVGNVCMDMIMVNVSDIKCAEGDEVVVFDKKHRADQLAEGAGTISYELLTALSRRIKRSYLPLKEHK
ncbi:MAG: alanine racemase [Flavobacteriaceae bacterium]|nr:alanine racemase [Flavobacteriaceae bacterium]MDP4674419.1 alanine racemase [Flavobacteriaceae bacterium]MDP4754304.1 alanine racemase [Flavobacteriaceae bacterium]MDP4794282.1 alanine racemase [Flavobacteriaceae bacterium]MDP4885758.1 alanine racemase [Flavobacteriaceae bacterium]